MADDVDRADAVIQHVIDDARANAKRALDNPSLRPIIQVMDDIRFGVCHYCESPIRPGHLFCPNDPIDPAESCAVMWEYEMRRKRELGL